MIENFHEFLKKSRKTRFQKPNAEYFQVHNSKTHLDSPNFKAFGLPSVDESGIHDFIS